MYLTRPVPSTSGRGRSHWLGDSGASHGGLGGRGGCGTGLLSCLLPRSMPYGNALYPTDFGSGGAGALGGIGESLRYMKPYNDIFRSFMPEATTGMMSTLSINFVKNSF